MVLECMLNTLHCPFGHMLLLHFAVTLRCPCGSSLPLGHRQRQNRMGDDETGEEAGKAQAYGVAEG